MKAPHPLRFGRPAAPPSSRTLRAGPLTLLLEEGDLRYVKLGETEVLRRVYAAVRDRNWGTVPGRLANLVVDAGADSFHVTFEVEHRQGEIHFVWRAAIDGAADGTVTFAMDGEARSTFLRNRIGLCVLHPAACAGLRAEIRHADGSASRGVFPALVDGDQPIAPFANLRAVAHPVRRGVLFEVELEGDLFEAEDQRNWTDGSFKIFSTPLALPFPVEVKSGTRVQQKVTLRLRPEGSAAFAPVRSHAAAPVRISVARTAAGALPAIGFGVASHGARLGEAELAALRPLRPAHLRVDWSPSDGAADERLARAADEAGALSSALELALTFAPDEAPALARVRAFLERERPALARCLVYPARELYQGGSPTRAVVLAARAALGSAAVGMPFGAGTNADLIFYNRTPPPADLLDLVTFAVNPQVHASDELSLVETLEAQEAATRTAAHRGGGLPVVVSPVTLRPRFNPYATGPAPTPGPDSLPPEVDARQATLFGAAWTIGSLRAFATAGARSVTFYETTGWRGLIERPGGTPLPALFPSRPSTPFPMYHVFADVAALPGARLRATQSSDRLSAEALAFEAGGRLRLLVANLTARPQRVRLEGLSARVHVRRLDDDSLPRALAEPSAFMRDAGERQVTRGGMLELDLPPCGSARLDGAAVP